MSDTFTPVKSALRTLEIIDLLARNPDGLSFVEVQRHVGWPRGSVFNLLRTMVEPGYLDFDESDRRYRIGLRVWEAGQAYTRARDLARIAHPYLEAARDALNETVQLAVLEGIENVYIAKVESDHQLKLVSDVGSRLPAYATGLGKALLAGLEGAELDRRLRGVKLQAFTNRTIVDKTRLKAELNRVRADGFATDHGEFSVGVYCVAVPIHDGSGEVIAAMSASVPEARVTETVRTAMHRVLAEEGARLSKEFGYQDRLAGS